MESWVTSLLLSGLKGAEFHGMPFAYAQLSERPPTMRPLGDDD